MNTHRIKFAAIASAFALAGGLGLAAAPAATAAPAPGAFAVSSIGKLPSTIKLTKSTKEHAFTVSLTGTPADAGYTDSNSDGAYVSYRATTADYSSWYKATRVSTVVKKANVIQPTIWGPTTAFATGTVAGFTLRVSPYTTPGKYNVSVPITQSQSVGYDPTTKVTRWVTKTVTIVAPAAVGKSQTSYSSNTWKTGQTAKITVRAPEFKKGAKAYLYYRAPGAKKFKVVAKKKFTKAKNSRVTVTLKSKKLRVGGRAYVKVSKNKYAKAYKFKSQKIKRMY